MTAIERVKILFTLHAIIRTTDPSLHKTIVHFSLEAKLLDRVDLDFSPRGRLQDPWQRRPQAWGGQLELNFAIGRKSGCLTTNHRNINNV